MPSGTLRDVRGANPGLVLGNRRFAARRASSRRFSGFPHADKGSYAFSRTIAALLCTPWQCREAADSIRGTKGRIAMNKLNITSFAAATIFSATLAGAASAQSETDRI